MNIYQRKEITMKMSRFIPMLTCFGLAAGLYLLDQYKIILVAGRLNIQIYPVVAFTLLGLILLWHTVKTETSG